MFRETLLESAASHRKRSRWPMAMAFTAELIVAALLVTIPLLSTGVISVSAHVPLVAPLGRPDVKQAPHPPAGGRTSGGHSLIVPLVTAGTRIRAIADSYLPGPDVPDGVSINIGEPDSMPNLPFGGPAKPPEFQEKKAKAPVVISHLSEAQLINRVEPVYPHIAIITGTQGAVRLHAIIAKDGSIQSLSVMGGPAMLANAALEAVRQWRYKPYYLNGEPVEVETFITVNFKKTNE